MVLKEFPNLSYMLDMNFPSLTIHQYIMKEDKDKCVKVRYKIFTHEGKSSLRNVNLFLMELVVS